MKIFVVDEECHGDVSYWLTKKRAKKEVVHILAGNGWIDGDDGEIALPENWENMKVKERYKFLTDCGATSFCDYRAVRLNKSWR